MTFSEEHTGPTPNGGVKSVAYYFRDGEPCDKSEATEVRIVEYDANGRRVNETYGYTRPKSQEETEIPDDEPTTETSRINLPDYYQKVNTLPDDPKHCEPFYFKSGNTECLLKFFPIRADEAMDFYDEAKLIDGIHNTVAANQALVEVRSGETSQGRRYIYSIVKTHKEPHGVQYCVLLHISLFRRIIADCIQAFYDEIGTTGERDAMVYAMLQSNGTLEKLGGMDAWQQDPYDHHFKRDYLMNLSELEQFDEAFPGHPLTLARKMIKHVVTNN